MGLQVTWPGRLPVLGPGSWVHWGRRGARCSGAGLPVHSVHAQLCPRLPGRLAEDALAGPISAVQPEKQTRSRGALRTVLGATRTCLGSGQGVCRGPGCPGPAFETAGGWGSPGRLGTRPLPAVRPAGRAEDASRSSWLLGESFPVLPRP